MGLTTIGRNNVIFPFATVGTIPQDLKYRGEPSELIIGDDNQIREFVSLNPGTVGGGMITRVGNHNLLMMYCHIAHDCIVGNRNVIANGATLGGHVTIEDHVIVGGLVGIHQFVRIGCGSDPRRGLDGFQRCAAILQCHRRPRQIARPQYRRNEAARF